MTITIHAPFHGKPSLSRAGFIAILERTGSFKSEPLWGATPAAARIQVAEHIYGYISSSGHDPGRWLGILGKESSFGTNQDSVLWRNLTRSWTNARSIRHPDVVGEIITDRVRQSQYVRYQSALDSVRDGVYRIDDPAFAYQQAGARTILEVIQLFAPGSDGNYPRAYAQTMADWINAWAAEFPVDDGGDMAAQIPGFRWLPANDTHFTRGRTQKIIGGAQHYTAGTDSRAWLTWQSGTNPPNPNARVSSTLLMRKNATMEFRGWQLVRLEDTAWTTGGWANPRTVSLEYEHRVGQPIPDSDYEIMAQTWIDVATEVTKRNLGTIPLSRSGIRGHKEWVNEPSRVCPDGISMDRLVAEIAGRSRPAPPSPVPVESCTFFPQTRQYLCHGFRGFWEENGGLSIFGYPLSTEFTNDDGITVQWCERARLEHQPSIARNKHGVVLGLVGAESRKQDEEDYPEAFEPQDPPT